MSNEEDPGFVVCCSLTNSQKKKKIVPSTTHYPIHQPYALQSQIKERERVRERYKRNWSLFFITHTHIHKIQLGLDIQALNRHNMLEYRLCNEYDPIATMSVRIH
jgi:hypothetical protein